MPCNQIRMTSLDFKVANMGYLKQAMEMQFGKGTVRESGNVLSASTMYGNVSIDQTTGQITVREGSEHIVDPLKRKYSEVVIRENAKKMGWTVRKVSDTKFQVVKRSM